jgi:hypothetical protein
MGEHKLIQMKNFILGWLLSSAAASAFAESLADKFGFDVIKALELGVIGLGFVLAFLAYRLLDKIQSVKEPDRGVLRLVQYFMVFSVVLCGITLAAQIFDQRDKLGELKAQLDLYHGSKIALSNLSGRIETPKIGDTLPQVFASTGWVSGMKEGSGVHLWLAAEKDGRLWPKGREIPVGKDGKWSATVMEEGREPSFSLALIATGEVANGKILTWMADNEANGKYPSMDGVQGIVKLHRVDKLVVKK